MYNIYIINLSFFHNIIENVIILSVPKCVISYYLLVITDIEVRNHVLEDYIITKNNLKDIL